MATFLGLPSYGGLATAEREDPAGASGYPQHPPRMGFFTDTSVCIGCKACEVACKEWNAVPEAGQTLTGMSYDNSDGLGASTWRHVAFIEQPVSVAAGGTPRGAAGGTSGNASGGVGSLAGGSVDGDAGSVDGDGGTADGAAGQRGVRWLMASDVCKHCTHAACLDVCPTGALFRTEFGTVVVQSDVCNGCGYCVPACPYGVIDIREEDGRAWKCTLCYDRLQVGMEPACAKTCPTDSIQFGELDELRGRAQARLEQLHEAGATTAQLYGEDPDDGVGGQGSIFLLMDTPETYGLPPAPVVTTRDLPAMWRRAGVAAATLLAGAVLAFVGAGGRQGGHR